jgi:predicted ester cyclase
MSSDYLNHAATAEYRHSIESARHVINWLFTVFPDHRFDIEDVVADGYRVAVRGTCSGTQAGELWGISPTGERFAVQQVHWFRLADGKVAEHWVVRDALGLMRQLGVLPTQRHSEKVDST